jgi:hypothetical protein
MYYTGEKEILENVIVVKQSKAKNNKFEIVHRDRDFDLIIQNQA